MGTRYYRLFDLLNRRGMKKSDLRKILSPNTVAKLTKGEHISGEAIEKICLFLHCQPGDIMEVVAEVESFENGDIKLLEKSYIVTDAGDVATDELIELKGTDNYQVLKSGNPLK